MSGGGWRLDLPWLLDVFADRLTMLVRSDSVSVALRRGLGRGPDVLVTRGPFFHRREVVDEAFAFLQPELLRCGRPLRVPVDDLPADLKALKAALGEADASGIAAFPVYGDGELAGCCMAPIGGTLAFPQDEAAWTSCETARRTVGLVAATLALGTLEELRAHDPAGREVDGVMTVDASGRILIARGLCRELLTRAGAPPVGARVQDVLGETSLSTLLDGEEDEMVWTEHVLPPSEGRGIAAAIAVAPRSARAAHGFGHRVVCVRDLRAEPGRRPLDLGFELAAEVICAIDAVDIDGPSSDPESVALLPGVDMAIVARLVKEAADLVEDALPPGIRSEGLSGGRLNDLVRGSLQLSERALATERIRVFSLLQPELPSASVDPVLLFRALRRLVDTARASLGGRGGSLTVKSGQMDDQPYVTVSDDGGGRSGYPEERVGLPLFHLGETASESECGDVRELLKRAGAKMWVERRPGLWTRATLLLPAMSSPAFIDDTDELPSCTVDPRGLSVLVVDDNPALRSVLRRYLERRGHEVTEASDGDEGLSAVADRDFDWLIVDVHMPGKGGPEFYEGLGRSAPQLRPRTIFMTGGYLEGTVERFILESGRPSLAKPFDLEELARAVET